MIEFEAEGFRLLTRPKWNKKERRNLGIPKNEIKLVQVASGWFTRKGTRRKIVRTAEILSSMFNTKTGMFIFKTANGKSYTVRYKPEEASV